MTDLFYTILNMSISASILVLVVLLLRLFVRKAPKWVAVLLWGLVAVRLVCPFALETPFSLMPKTDWFTEDTSYSEENMYFDSVAPEHLTADPNIADNVNVHYYPLINPQIEDNRGMSLAFVLNCIWLGGIGVMLVYLAVSYIRVYRQIRNAEQFRGRIYTSANVASPFVFGVIRPRICLPENMDAVSMSYVIAHEEAHIRRKDHWWKPIGFLLLTLHWFNPVMWLAYILLCRDIEMACDERVVKEYNESQRADYSEALLECSVNHSRSRRLISACPLAFGEVGVQQRIKSVLHYKKPGFWIIAAAVIACIAAAVCFLTNPQKEIKIESVSAMTVNNDIIVSGEYMQTLVSLINDSKKTYFRVGLDDPNDLSIPVLIDCSDGSMYLLHYQYYSGFSFNPAHPGEDDYRSILTYFSPDGKEDRAWRLEYDFDEHFRKWYDEVITNPEITASAGEIISSNISEQALDYEVLRQQLDEIRNKIRHNAVSASMIWEFQDKFLSVTINPNTNYITVLVRDFTEDDINRFAKTFGHFSYILVSADDQSTIEAYAKAEAEKEALMEAYAKAEAEKEALMEAYAKAEAEKEALMEAYAKAEAEKEALMEAYTKAEAENETDHKTPAEFTAVIKEFDTDAFENGMMSLNIVEFITRDDTERIAELELSKQDMISGYYIHDEDESITPLKLPENTEFIFFDWWDAYTDETDERYEILGERWISTRDAELFYEYWLPYADSPGYPFTFHTEEGKLVIKEIPLM